MFLFIFLFYITIITLELTPESICNLTFVILINQTFKKFSISFPDSFAPFKNSSHNKSEFPTFLWLEDNIKIFCSSYNLFLFLNFLILKFKFNYNGLKQKIKKI